MDPSANIDPGFSITAIPLNSVDYELELACSTNLNALHFWYVINGAGPNMMNFGSNCNPSFSPLIQGPTHTILHFVRAMPCIEWKIEKKTFQVTKSGKGRGSSDEIKLINTESRLASEEEVENLIAEMEKSKIQPSLGYNISLYPNPTNGEFQIEMPEESSFNRVEVMNIVGKQLFVKNTNSEKRMSFDLSNQPKGLYLVKISSDNETIVKKVMHQ